MKILMTLLILVPSLLWAADGKDDLFEKHKKMALDALDIRISQAQHMRTCVAAAHAHADIKKCHQEDEKAREDLASKIHENRKEKIDNQIKRLEQEKKAMESAPKSGE